MTGSFLATFRFSRRNLLYGINTLYILEIRCEIADWIRRKKAVLYVVTPCSLVDMYRRVRGTSYSLH